MIHTIYKKLLLLCLLIPAVSSGMNNRSYFFTYYIKRTKNRAALYYWVPNDKIDFDKVFDKAPCFFGDPQLMVDEELIMPNKTIANVGFLDDIMLKRKSLGYVTLTLYKRKNELKKPKFVD